MGSRWQRSSHRHSRGCAAVAHGALAEVLEASAVCWAPCCVGQVTGSDGIPRYWETPSNLAFDSSALKTTLLNVAGHLVFQH